MLLAPLVAVLAILALPLWPVAIALLGVVWLLLWPLERVISFTGAPAMRGWSAAVGRVFYIVLKPWVYIEKRYPRAAPSERTSPTEGRQD